MNEKPEDLTIPNAVVARLIKDALPEGVLISKEARAAISKSASVFILFATSTANMLADQSKRKTISAADIFNALQEMDFIEFVEPLQTFLKEYKEAQSAPKATATIAAAGDNAEDVHTVTE